MAKEISRKTLDQLLIPSTATLTSVLRQHGITWTFMHRCWTATPQYEDGRSRIHPPVHTDARRFGPGHS